MYFPLSFGINIIVWLSRSKCYCKNKGVNNLGFKQFLKDENKHSKPKILNTLLSLHFNSALPFQYGLDWKQQLHLKKKIRFCTPSKRHLEKQYHK